MNPIKSMNTKALLTLLPITLGLIATGIFGMSAHVRADAGGPAPKPAAAAAASAETESSARVNVTSLAGKLEFLGDKPVLAGHPLLIEFWATWCPPCRASIAHLNELNQKYHDRGLQIVGITGEDKAVVEAFRARVPMHYAVALDANQTLATEFHVQTIPQAWLLDKDGRVIWSGHPMELDEETIARVLPTHPAT
jgi:thiol-disulfide isomerase/thioredoxin